MKLLTIILNKCNHSFIVYETFMTYLNSIINVKKQNLMILAAHILFFNIPKLHYNDAESFTSFTFQIYLSDFTIKKVIHITFY